VLETADQVASVAGLVVAVAGLVLALRGRRSPTTAERLDRLAGVVAAQWRDEAEIRGITTAWTTVELPAHRRLVVVGPSGAGKTVAAVRLVREVLAHRASGDPVAVLFALHSWNPERQHPHEWMAAELAGGYGMPVSVARELVRARHVVPVLDGLDEVADPPAALRALRRVHDPGAPDPLVLTSRDRVELPGAVVVELGPPRVPGWEGVTSPLLLWLAMASDTGPRELTGPSRDEVERRLLDRFVSVAYPEEPRPDGRRPRWRARRVDRWLRFLAREDEIAWWRLIRTVPRPVIVVLPAVAVGAVVWTGLWVCGLGVGLATGAAVSNALFVALMGVVRPWPDVSGLRAGVRLHLPGALGGFAFGFLLGLVVGPVAAVVAGTVSGVAWGAVGRIDAGTPPRSAGPLSVLRADLVVAVVGGLPVPLVLATVVAFAGSPSRAPLGFAALWLFYGIGWLAVTAWSRFLLARLWLAVRGLTPLRLMAFLADAHRRGVLRRSGPVHEFRHARLRERLAASRTSED
jgi:hypothetical protein